MDDLTIIIPFYNGHEHIKRLVSSIPKNITVLIIDDMSIVPLTDTFGTNISVKTIPKKGYFAGAVNYGIGLCDTDVLVLNQDTFFYDNSWVNMLQSSKHNYAFVGEGISGTREDFPNGYIHGTFMYMRRDAIDEVGLLNEDLYPLWGNTAEWQLRICRAGYKALPLKSVTGFTHKREVGTDFGSSITSLLKSVNRSDRRKLINTPPEISVIIPTHGVKYTSFLPDAIASLVGGDSSLGKCKPQTFQSFEVIVIEDGAKKETTEIIKSILNEGWSGISHVQTNRIPLDKNGTYVGKPTALNFGIEKARGKYITVLDVDDMMEPDRLETLWNAAEEDEGFIVYDGIIRMVNGERTGLWPMRDYDPNELPKRNSMPIGIFYTKEMWKKAGGYNKHALYGREDWAFNLALQNVGITAKQLDYAGYLYRRDGQNRTIKNTKPEWREMFANMMKAQYPALYEDNYMCCGNNGSGDIMQIQSATVPGSEGMSVIVYVGTRVGSFTVYGVTTSTRYRVTPSVPFYVDSRDLYGAVGYNGFLELMENGKPLYEEVVEEAPIVEKVEAPVEEAPAEVQSLTMDSQIEEEEVEFDIVAILNTLTTLRAYLKNNTVTEDQIVLLVEHELANANRTGAFEALNTYV